MKKLISLLIITLLTTSVAFGHGRGWGWNNNGDDSQWKDMDKWHDVMHSVDVKSAKIDNGIILNLTVEDTEILNTLKSDFKVNEKDLAEYFKNTKVTLKDKAEGMDITIVTDDAKIAESLNRWQDRLIFSYLRDQMRDGFMGSRGYGPGCRGGGYGHRGWGMMNWDDDRNSGFRSGPMM